MPRKATGGKVELLVERVVGPDEAWAQLRASHAPRPGATLHLPGGAAATVHARDDRFFLLRFAGTGSLVEWLDRHGDVPLPPYIGRGERRGRPTTRALPDRLRARARRGRRAHRRPAFRRRACSRHSPQRGVARAFVTLHVGAGTFLPGADGRPRAAPDARASGTRCRRRPSMPSPRRARRGGRVVAVGTTSLRALESAASRRQGLRAGSRRDDALHHARASASASSTALLTNFHLPRSTLLMLVSAFAGYDTIRAAYAHAIAARYRFFSYGDAMLLERATALEVTPQPDTHVAKRRCSATIALEARFKCNKTDARGALVGRVDLADTGERATLGHN